MAKVKLVRLMDADVEGDKRQHFPYKLQWICSSCGQNNEWDYSRSHYLTEPLFPGIYEIQPCCSGCGHEEDPVTLETDITLQVSDG